ncbi:hypothetical protein [Microbacterium sp. SORGH_AS_0862]|uniref:hypothetical protein n=1 Tax=Microbacterium sp. SORGH_AS_0862 TaxID=3041789 RepID=UPI0027912858|nr:hypothetical protein [Microbacterium sp. SORGH_AS_0862]MDQ1205096.1 hypothetical protein [Microbacterium sp. SORGH_AS_0862]
MADTLDDVVFSFDAARRDVLSAVELIETVIRDASGLAAATAWASPAMGAFQLAHDAWTTALADERRRLLDLDDVIAEIRTRALVTGGGNLFGWSS